MLSAERPLGVWKQGLRITAGFPAYLGTQPPSATPIDAYYVLTALGITLFTSPSDVRGPAAVSFSASPTDVAVQNHANPPQERSMKRQQKKGKQAKVKDLKVKPASSTKAAQVKGGLKPDSEDEIYVGQR